MLGAKNAGSTGLDDDESMGETFAAAADQPNQLIRHMDTNPERITQ